MYLISQLLFSFQGACSISASSRCLRTRFTADRWLILAFARISARTASQLLSSFEKMVGSSGLEPPTSRLSGARSNHLSYEPVSLSAASVFFGFLFLCPFYGLGGDDGIRTHDPLLAGQVLSQLSYTPILGFFPSSLSLSAEDKLPQN